jgi:hypothetical protein
MNFEVLKMEFQKIRLKLIEIVDNNNITELFASIK